MINMFMRIHEIITEKQHIFSNPSFKKWFSGSKIVDKNGLPMIVYHGTATAFEEFEVTSIGSIFNDDNHGFFFTNNTSDNMASGYAYMAAAKKHRNYYNTTGANIIPTFVKIINPYTFADYAYSYEYGDGTKESVINKIIDGRSLIEWFDLNKKIIIQDALADGHDGVFLYDPKTNIGDNTSENLVVAFRPEQIKSIFNKTFNHNSTKLSETIFRESWEKDVNIQFHLSTEPNLIPGKTFDQQTRTNSSEGSRGESMGEGIYTTKNPGYWFSQLAYEEVGELPTHVYLVKINDGSTGSMEAAHQDLSKPEDVLVLTKLMDIPDDDKPLDVGKLYYLADKFLKAKL